jgi:hypothetical protein
MLAFFFFRALSSLIHAIVRCAALVAEEMYKEREHQKEREGKRERKKEREREDGGEGRREGME